MDSCSVGGVSQSDIKISVCVWRGVALLIYLLRRELLVDRHPNRLLWGSGMSFVDVKKCAPCPSANIAVAGRMKVLYIS